MKTIADKLVVLTGASGGIGEFIARALAKEQATVVGISRSPAGLERVGAEVEALGGKWLGIPFNLCELDKLPDLVAQIQQLTGRHIDILINNAAIEKFRPFQTYTLEDTQSILTTNLLSPMELTRLVMPSMLKRGSGHIVNISSGSGKKGAPFNSIYSASKAGLIMWSDAIRQELADTNIGVSVVCPGCTNAGMYLALGQIAPSAAQITEPTEVADRVLQAIAQNQKEVVIDGFNLKFLFAMSQFFPQFGDMVFQKLGVVKTNQSCAEYQMQAQKLA
ncbi:SDR family NAD(P)-dependent oxidoreductase [Aliterella atlantica]|uniref:Ketoacyl reductase n=1 Tax=Aliterella atlantica CENA595 TaxID=1618023 RepID=A0A0D8ZTJ7_9CYAN|nr:SDR family oxidoreductase [Aliterella atlantica]KJH71682.1 ketoacyl reductase [Aliterella atlantica CENA595]